MISFLAEAGVVDHENALGRAHELGHVPLSLADDGVLVPARRHEESLQRPHPALSDLERHRLGVPLAGVREKPCNVRLDKGLHLLAAEVLPVSGEELPEKRSRLAQLFPCHGRVLHGARGSHAPP